MESLGENPFGAITPYPFVTTPPGAAVIFCLAFLLHPRSRGTFSVTGKDYGQQPSIMWNFYSDGTDPTDPSSGLTDPGSDISNACAFMDYVWNVVQLLQGLQGGTNPYGVQMVNPPASVFQVADQPTRCTRPPVW
jgi:hypothetical protein